MDADTIELTLCTYLSRYWPISLSSYMHGIAMGDDVNVCVISTKSHDINILTHLGRVTHICVSKVAIIGSDNDLSPDRRHAIIRPNAGIRPLWTKFIEISIDIHTFPFKKIHFKMSSGKWRPFCLGLNAFKFRLQQNGRCNHIRSWDILSINCMPLMNCARVN